MEVPHCPSELSKTTNSFLPLRFCRCWQRFVLGRLWGRGPQIAHLGPLPSWPSQPVCWGPLRPWAVRQCRCIPQSGDPFGFSVPWFQGASAGVGKPEMDLVWVHGLWRCVFGEIARKRERRTACGCCCWLFKVPRFGAIDTFGRFSLKVIEKVKWNDINPATGL